MKAIKGLVGLLMLGGVLGTAAATGGASSLKGGTVDVHVTGAGNGAGADMILTGAIGDFGTATTVDKQGTPDNNGNYVVFGLSQGTIRINVTSLNDKTNNERPNFNTTTCSGDQSASSSVPITGGTGAYKGIKGSFNVTLTFEFVGAKVKSGKHAGQCDQSESSQPLAQGFTATGSGNVSYS